MPRPVTQSQAATAPVAPDTAATSPQPVVSASRSDLSNKGWMIGAGAMAAVLIAWLAWSWPNSTVASAPAQPQTEVASIPAETPTVPTPAPAPISQRPAAPAEQAKPTPVTSPWDSMFAPSLPGQ